MSNLKQKFGCRVKELRKRKIWTQEYLAEIINLDTRSLRKIESGDSFPSITTLELLIAVLEISTVELFDFEHNKSHKDLMKETLDIIKANPQKIVDIYKIVRAIVN